MIMGSVNHIIGVKDGLINSEIVLKMRGKNTRNFSRVSDHQQKSRLILFFF